MSECSETFIRGTPYYLLMDINVHRKPEVEKMNEKILGLMERELKGKRAELERFQNEIQPVEEKIKTLNERERKLKEKLKRVKAQKEKLNKRIVEKRRKVKELEAEVKRYEKAINALRDEKTKKPKKPRTAKFKVKRIGTKEELINVSSVAKLKYELRRYYEDDTFIELRTIDDILRYIKKRYNSNANIEAKKTVLILWV